MIVMMIAITPSLKASNRPLPICLQPARQISERRQDRRSQH